MAGPNATDRVGGVVRLVYSRVDADGGLTRGAAGRSAVCGQAWLSYLRLPLCAVV
jgi:hypothetical protein